MQSDDEDVKQGLVVTGDGSLGRKQHAVEKKEEAEECEVAEASEDNESVDETNEEKGSDAATGQPASAVFSVPGFTGFSTAAPSSSAGSEPSPAGSGSAAFSVPGFTGFSSTAKSEAKSEAKPESEPEAPAESTAASPTKAAPVVLPSGASDGETRNCFSCLGTHPKSVSGCPDRWQCEKCRLFHKHEVAKCPTCFPDPNAARIVGRLPEEDYSEQEFSEVGVVVWGGRVSIVDTISLCILWCGWYLVV